MNSISCLRAVDAAAQSPIKIGFISLLSGAIADSERLRALADLAS